MSENAAFVIDDGDLRKYRTEIPNLVLEMGLDPYAGWLYLYLKRVAGDTGVCWQGVRGLATATGMSAGAVCKGKRELQRRGLISIKEGDGRRGEADEISVTNIWQRNFAHFDSEPKSAPNARSPHEHAPVHHMNTSPRSPHEHADSPRSGDVHPPKSCSPGEHKKEPNIIKETHEHAKGGTESRRSKLSDEEAAERFEALVSADDHGDALREMAELLAEENTTRKVASTRVWREIGSRYMRTRARTTLGEDAWAYGFDQALSRGKPNIGYALKAAEGYKPDHVIRSASGGGISATPGSAAEVYDAGGY